MREGNGSTRKARTTLIARGYQAFRAFDWISPQRRATIPPPVA
jgi:hypothetical protein